MKNKFSVVKRRIICFSTSVRPIPSVILMKKVGFDRHLYLKCFPVADSFLGLKIFLNSGQLIHLHENRDGGNFKVRVIFRFRFSFGK